MYNNRLLHVQTHIPRGPSGRASRMSVGIGGGTVNEGERAVEKLLHTISD